MTIQFSEVVIFVADPESSAQTMKQSLNCIETERFGDSWILLESPGRGRFGYMKHIRKSDEPWPAPMIAFQSTDIEADVIEIQSLGLPTSDVEKGETMWHSTYTDEHGNKYLIWQAQK